MLKIQFCLSIILLILSNYTTLQQKGKDSSSLKCYQCNSLSNKSCAIAPKTDLSTVACDDGDTCVTAIAEGITYRGCSSNFGNYSRKVHCNTNLCNNEIYPENRLRCYNCSGGIDCVNLQSSQNSGEICSYYKADDQCFTDVIDETDAVRGCISDGNYKVGPYAQLCSKNGCNNQMGTYELKCINCSSLNSLGCKRPPIINDDDITKCKITETNSCTVQQLLGRPSETCFTYHNLDTVIRGCTRFSGLLQINARHFKECEGTFCNQECLNPLKCYNCNSVDNPGCKTKPENENLVNCTSETSSCYTCEYADESIYRGCGKPAGELNNCQQCDDSIGCNRNTEIRRCYNCTSETDPNCATWQYPSEIVQQICPTPNDHCVTFTERNGHTHRGCESELNFDCDYKSYCARCSGNLCNSGIFPKNRHKCYQCTGLPKSDDHCATNSSTLLPCRKNLEINGCFAYIDYENQQVVRGCLSDLEKFNRCELLDDKCIQCDDSECNKHELLKPPRLSCIKCNSTAANNLACAWGQKLENATKCETDVPFYLNENCFMYSNNDSTFIRGCNIDDRMCDERNIFNRDENCQICGDSNGCNRKSFRIQSCLACNSKDSPGCTNTSGDYHKECNNSAYMSYDQRGCFTKRQDKDIIRGCANDLSSQELDQCKKFDGSKSDDSFCQYCDGQSCNIIDLKNSNLMNRASIILILLCMIGQQNLKSLRALTLSFL